MQADDYEGAGGVEFEPQGDEYDREDGSGVYPRDDPFGQGNSGERFEDRRRSGAAASVSSHSTSDHGEGRRHSPYRDLGERMLPHADPPPPVDAEPKQRSQAREYIPVSQSQTLSTLAAARMSTSKAVPITSGPIKHVPSYVVSTAAAHRKEASELTSGYAKLEKAHLELQGKLTEATRRIKDLQREADVATRDKINAQRRTDALEKKSAELEVQLLRATGASSPSGKAETGRVMALEKKVAELTSHKDTAIEALRRESKLLEESRSYISVLLSAMEGKGMVSSGEQNAALLTELRRLRSEVESRSKDSSVREVASSKLEEQLRDLQARHTRLTQRFHDLQQGGGTAARVATLESEREALMDYLQERKAEVGRLNDRNTVLAADNAQLQAEFSRLSRTIDAESEARSRAKADADSLRRELATALTAKTGLESDLRAANDEITQLSATVEAQARELEDTTAIQVELLNTVREHKRGADDALGHAHAVEEELAVVKNALSRTQATLRSREEEAARTTADLNSVTSQLAAAQESLNRLQSDFKQLVHEKDSLARQLTSTESDLKTVNDRLEASQATRAQLEGKVGTLEARLSSATMDLTALRAGREAIDAAEEKLSAVLAKEDVAEREEEREMGLKRLYKHSSGAEVSLFDYDVAFAYDGGSPTASGAPGEEDNAIVQASTAASVALSRAERGVRWASSAEVAGTVPNIAAGARRLSAWLRAAGVALGETARLAGAERREKRSQRRLLHDEIHTLRQEADSLHAALKGDRGRLTDTEATLHSVSRARETEVAQLRGSLEACESRAAKAEASLAETTAQLGNTESRLKAALDELAATSKSLSQLRDECEQLRSRLSAADEEVSKLLSSKSSLQAALSSASAHIEELTLTLQSRERELDNNARHADTEKRVLVEKIRSLETHGGEVTSRSAELEAEVTTLRAALEDAKSEKEKLAREYDILQLRKATQEQDIRKLNAESESIMADLKAELDDAEAKLRVQARDIDSLSRSKAELEDTVAVLQRNVLAFTQENESSRLTLQTGLEDSRRRIQTSSKISGVVSGMDEVFDELNSFAEQTSSSSPVWRERESGRLRFGTVNIPLKAAAELSVCLSRRLTDNIIELLHRLATTSSDAERLKAIIESSKPHIEALETATSNSYERAQALVFAESRVAELRAELASRSSQQDVMSRELEHLRRQCVEYQQEADRSATLLAKAAGECDVARAAAQRLTGQLEDCERRKREAEIELARLRGSRDVDVQERRRVELEANRDQSKVAEIMKEMETLQAGRLRLEASLTEYRSALSAARQDHAAATAEITQMTKQVVAAESRLAAKDNEIQELNRIIGDLRREKSELERRLSSEMSSLTSDQQELLRARNDAMTKLAKATADMVEAKAEARRQGDLYRVTQTSLEECRALLAQLREEKAALTARLARLETFGYTHEPTPMSTSLSLMSGQIDRAKLSRANEDLQQQLKAANEEVSHLREDVDLTKIRLAGLTGRTASPPRQPTLNPSPTRGSLIRLEGGEVRAGDSLAYVGPGPNGGTVYRSDTGASVQVTRRDGPDAGIRVDVVPAPGRPSLPPQMYSSPYSRTPGDDDASSIGGYSSHSTSSPMSAGGERLKDRLRRVQETFAQLRHSAV